MNIKDASTVLAKAAAYDRRTVGDPDILAWHEALSDLDCADALAAVAAHYRESTDWLMPAHIRRLAETARQAARRAERLAAEEAHRLAVEAAPPVTRDRSGEVLALLHELRDRLRPGKPDQLRRPEVLEWERANLRRDRAAGYDEPNPAFEGFPAAPDAQPSEVEDQP